MSRKNLQSFQIIFVWNENCNIRPINWHLGEGNGTPLQYSCLENPMDGGAWWAAVHGLVKSRTRLSDFTFTFHFPALEKEMATHSSVLAWRIPETGEPGGLPSVGSHRVGHDWSDLAATDIYILIKIKYSFPLQDDISCRFYLLYIYIYHTDGNFILSLITTHKLKKFSGWGIASYINSGSG